MNEFYQNYQWHAIANATVSYVGLHKFRNNGANSKSVLACFNKITDSSQRVWVQISGKSESFTFRGELVCANRHVYASLNYFDTLHSPNVLSSYKEFCAKFIKTMCSWNLNLSNVHKLANKAKKNCLIFERPLHAFKVQNSSSARRRNFFEGENYQWRLVSSQILLLILFYGHDCGADCLKLLVLMVWIGWFHGK